MAHGRDILKPLVLDNGSKFTKAGFAGDGAPCSVFHSIVGSPMHKDCSILEGRKETYVGNEAFAKRGILSIRRPIVCGIIKKWEYMEKFWDHTFCKELGVAPELHPVILTEALFNPKSNRERMAEIMFEGFHVPAMYAIIQSIASLYSSGHTTGIVIESGENVSYTVPIYEGYAIPHAISRLDLAGFHLKNNRIFYEECSYPTNLTIERVTAEDFFRKSGYVAPDFEKELKLAKEYPSAIEAAFELPCEETYTMRANRFYCPELLFQPSLVSIKSPGIHQLANNSIMKCDADIRKSLYETIVLSGGTTMFPGFARRISQEISDLAPNNMKIKVIAPKERNYSAWVGASILASLDSFQQMWISKADYDEYGHSIINWKCF